MRRLAALTVPLLGLLAVAACGGGGATPTAAPAPSVTAIPTPQQADPTAVPTPTVTRPADFVSTDVTSTAVPTPTATRPADFVSTDVTSTAVPTPTATRPAGFASIDVTAEHLPAMVLTQPEVELEFPSLRLAPAIAGFLNNEEAASRSISTGDSGAALAERGRLDGYTTQFLDTNVMSSGLSDQEHPLNLSISLDLLDSSTSARVYITEQVAEIGQLEGVDVDGNVIRDYRHAAVAELGETANVGRFSIKAAAFGATTEVGFIFWQRGPIVANLAAAGFDDSDRSEALERLARQMDRRIQRVLAGDIVPSAIAPTAVPTSAPTVTDQNGAEATILEEFDLPAMLPLISELPLGVVVTAEGFLAESSGLASYQREFAGAADLAPPITALRARVDLYDSPIEALAIVVVLAGLDSEALRGLVELSIGDGTTLDLEDMVVVPVTEPAIGDAFGGFHVSVVSPPVAREMYLLFSARGQVGSQILLQSPPGQPVLDEAIRIAQLIDERVVANSP